MPRMRWRSAIAPSSSVFSFATTTRPLYFAMVFSSGATMRHGPHHGAQKSTITGNGELRTSSSNELSSVTSNG